MEEVEYEKVHGVTVEDSDDGTYLVRYTPPMAGQYRVEASFKGTFGGTAVSDRVLRLISISPSHHIE